MGVVSGGGGGRGQRRAVDWERGHTTLSMYLLFPLAPSPPAGAVLLPYNPPPPAWERRAPAVILPCVALPVLRIELMN